MEPRSNERGNMYAHAAPRSQEASFNGATLKRTWKLKDDVRKAREFLALQWSHAQTNVETFFAPVVCAPVTKLQWSHAQTNVETPGGSPALGSNPHRFNGATLKRTWKLTWLGKRPPSNSCFNGATLKRTWKLPRRTCDVRL